MILQFSGYRHTFMLTLTSVPFMNIYYITLSLDLPADLLTYLLPTYLFIHLHQRDKNSTERERESMKHTHKLSSERGEKHVLAQKKIVFLSL